jgi:hypothetical protein
MKEVLTNGIRTRVTLVGFVEVRLLGLITPKINLIKSSIAVFLVAVTLRLTTAYQVITKSYNTVLKIVEPRSGEEIYTVLFGKTDNECLKIIDYQDQVIPKIDFAIWLHFKTCPEECLRILSEFDYSKEDLETKNWTSGTPLAKNIEWWNPKEMGTTIIVYEYAIKKSRNLRTLWISKDSTEIYCRDILD